MQKKLSILIDPDKPESYRVMEECIENKDLIERYDVEIWIGTSKCNFQCIEDCIKILNKVKLKPIVFPGRIDHALCYSKEVKAIFRPKLLNYTNPMMDLYVGGGKLLTSFFKFFFPFGPELWDYGYLVTGPSSTVGRKTGAIKLDKNGIYSLIENYLKKNPNGKGVYIEQGSGAKEPLSEEIVRNIRRRMPEKEIIVGGGIASPQVVKNLWLAGCNRCVVGTFFEKNPGKMREFIQNLFEN
jgi:putative glycerol-1-phosphate prenyltransferase